MPLLLVLGIIIAGTASTVLANSLPAASDPAESLREILTAACRHDETAFAGYLSGDNPQAYRSLGQEQRVALLRRMVLLEDPGKPLLSTFEGHTVLRCEAGGVTSELRFGAAEVHDNLAFIPVTVPEGTETQSVRFGLIKESGQWKLLSVGLLLVDIPSLGRQWEQSELQTRERQAIAAMDRIANALKAYQMAYGNLPETLDQLGPAPDGASPEKAGLLESALAAGSAGGYRIRYSIVPATGEEDESRRNKAAGFMLAATPVIYGKDGRRSFFLDASGMLRGGDKNGTVATADDPVIVREGSQQ